MKSKILLVVFIAIGCKQIDNNQIKSLERDWRKDISFATPIGNQYYSFLAINDFDKAYDLFDDQFKSKISRKNHLDYLTSIYQECGSILSFRIRGGSSFAGKEDIIFGCQIDYIVDYQKCPKKRESLFFLNKNGTILLDGFF